MDVYLKILLMFAAVTGLIAFISPADGGIRDPPLFPLFWMSIGGIIAIILYNGYKEKKKHHDENLKRKRKK